MDCDIINHSFYWINPNFSNLSFTSLLLWYICTPLNHIALFPILDINYACVTMYDFLSSSIWLLIWWCHKGNFINICVSWQWQQLYSFILFNIPILTKNTLLSVIFFLKCWILRVGFICDLTHFFEFFLLAFQSCICMYYLII